MTWSRDGVDDGYTMIELLVAMVIFIVVSMAFMAGLMSLTSTLRTSQEITQATEGLRNATYRLGRSVGQAAMVGEPALVNGNAYLEYRIDAVRSGEPPICVQWRYDRAAGVVDTRSWTSDGGVPSSWLVVVRNVVNDPAADPPFVVRAADAVRGQPRVRIDLRIAASDGPESSGQATFLVRNYDSERALPACSDKGRP